MIQPNKFSSQQNKLQDCESVSKTKHHSQIGRDKQQTSNSTERDQQSYFHEVGQSYQYQQYENQYSCCNDPNYIQCFLDSYGWMIPEVYRNWYQSLSMEDMRMYSDPESYSMIYNRYLDFSQYWSSGHHQFDPRADYRSLDNNPMRYSSLGLTKSVTSQLIIPNNKPSRNQKRRQRKEQLKQEYAKQQKAIGSWVRLQCKDLVQSLKQIEERQIRLKQKKKSKLGHLIEIHKEIYRHKVKKGKIDNLRGREGKMVGRKRLKLSNIKKMKMVYALNNDRKQFDILVKNVQKNPKDQNNQRNSKDPKDQKSSNDTNEKTMKRQMTPQQEKDFPSIHHTVTQKTNQKIHQQEEQDEDEYITDNDQSKSQDSHSEQKIEEKKAHEPKKRQTVQQKIQKIMQKEIKQIDYNHKSKLSEYSYNNVKLRQWMDVVPTEQLEDKALRLINRLAYKQAMNKVNKPQKAKKIIAAGIHQCKRTVTTIIDKKLSKCIILGTNVERNNLEKGTDDQIQELIGLASEKRIPVIHTSIRSRLGRAFTGKFGPRVTVISIINYQGYQDMMEEMLGQWEKAKKMYQQI